MAEINVREDLLDSLRAEMRSRGDSRNVEQGVESVIEDYLRRFAAGDYARDGLTGCLNRHKFVRDLDRASWGSSRTDRSLYQERFLCVDFANFKAYIDVHGFGLSDDALQELGKALMRAYGDANVYRWGGDDFVVILGNRGVSLPEVAEGLTLKHSVVEVAVQRNRERNHYVNAWILHHIDAGLLAARPDGHHVRCVTPSLDS